MRLVVASVAVVLGVSILLPAATAPTALALDASVEPSARASPTESVAPSGSPLPDAHITLQPAVESIPFRTWAVAVTGGTSSVDVLEAEDMGSGFSVTVFGQTATVELTLTLPSDLQLVAGCFDFDNQVPTGAVEPPGRLVLQVVQGGSYECSYGTECAGPSGPPSASVGLLAPTADFDASVPWAIRITGGRAVALGCSGPAISALKLAPDTEIPDALFGAFHVELFGESATVEITAPQPKGGRALASAQCEDQIPPDGLLYDVLVPPRRLVFEVVPFNTYSCDVHGRAGAVPRTVPPTDTLAGSPPGQSPGSWATILAGLAGVIAASLLILVRARRKRLR